MCAGTLIMARFGRILMDKDIGHYHCLAPEHHFHYLDFFDWTTERVLKWSGDDSLALQLEALRRNPLNNLTQWLCRAWDTLVMTCLVESTASEA